MHRPRITQLAALLSLVAALVSGLAAAQPAAEAPAQPAAAPTPAPAAEPAAPAAAPPAATEAPLIVSVEVEKNEYISREAILDVVKDILRVGEPFTAQKAEAARAAVMKMGYFQEVLVSQEAVQQGVKIIITVVERQRIEKITFVGNTVFTDATLLGIMRTKVGNIVDNDAIRRDMGRITDYYEQHGYLAEISQARVDTRTGVLSVVIDERRIEGFKVEGLKKTKEWVVRRMIETKPGVLFQQSMVAKDLQRIFNVGIFQSVKTEVRPGQIDPAAVIVVVQVEEKRTGVASIAAAYSDLDHFVMMLSVAENNFRGRAERASVDLEAFGRTSYDVSFYEPFLDKRNTSMDLSLFNTERRRRFSGMGIPVTDDRFRERRAGGAVRFSRPLGPTRRFSLGLRSEEVSSSYLVATHDLGSPGLVQPFSLVRPAQARVIIPVPPVERPTPGGYPGDIIVAAPLHPAGRVNSTTFEYTWDTRDLITDPKHGSFRDLSVEVAGGVFGGASNYNLYSAEQRMFIPQRRGKDVIALRLMLGTSTGDLPLFDSFSVGGGTTLRGYQEDRYRGESMVLGTLEYRYRVNESLQAVGFVDAGDAFGGTFPTVVPGFDIPAEDQKLTLHVGTGVGLRAVTPLGPIRIDWGVGSEGSEIHFGFGQVF
jgi:outer membrane protein insertion porin family